ncbi:MAG: hypothetical protein ABH967_02195 [Patescibacteria group bacterium]
MFLGIFTSLILQVNAFAQEVFLIQHYKNQLNGLSDNKENLEISLAQSSSLNNIEAYLKEENFTKPIKIKYIRILETSVAKNQ